MVNKIYCNAFYLAWPKIRNFSELYFANANSIFFEVRNFMFWYLFLVDLKTDKNWTNWLLTEWLIHSFTQIEIQNKNDTRVSCSFQVPRRLIFVSYFYLYSCMHNLLAVFKHIFNLMSYFYRSMVFVCCAQHKWNAFFLVYSFRLNEIPFPWYIL